MKNPTAVNTQNDNSKLNLTTILVLFIAILPILLYGLTRMCPPVASDTKSDKTIAAEEAAKKRVSAAERRAQRAEERKAKKAEKTTTVQHGMAPDPGMASFPAPMEPMDFGGFGPGMGGFDNGMAMAPGGFGGGFGGPGMGGGFGGGFGGPGMGFGGPF